MRAWQRVAPGGLRTCESRERGKLIELTVSFGYLMQFALLFYKLLIIMHFFLYVQLFCYAFLLNNLT